MSKKETSKIPSSEEKETCGIIMPISGSEGYPAEHWIEVKSIIDEVIESAGFYSNMVSEADEIGIIHNRIVSNIYNNPIIICDVSSKNPNVMFELGLRLAFDKATIIIKDDSTNYNFDTAPIEHLTYPRDLRYASINLFKEKLKGKLLSTHKAAKDPHYSTFLKNFVQYRPKLDVEEISSEKYILKQLEEISSQLAVLRNKESEKTTRISTKVGFDVKSNEPFSEGRLLEDIISLRLPLGKINIYGKENDTCRVEASFKSLADLDKAVAYLEQRNYEIDNVELL